jgi:Type IV secretion-system coupling protein DNA-binding domain
MITSLTITLLRAWYHLAPWLVALALVGELLLLARSLVLRIVPQEYWLREREAWSTQMMLWRYSWKWPWLLAALGLLALGARVAFYSKALILWACDHPLPFLGMHLGLLVMGVITLVLWDVEPSYIRKGEGRADAQFRDLPEDWGRYEIRDGRRVGDGIPMAALLGYRDPSRKARRTLLSLQRRSRYLVMIYLRWDQLSLHILVFGTQGSGKTTTIYGHLMRSANCVWIYQDGKAELPFRDWFPHRMVWGLDVRGYATRSAVLNFMEEIRSPEDFDLMVDMLYPMNPRDANPWVREMARTLFSAILRSRRWVSIQEISRTLRATTMELFLKHLDSIWKDMLKDPKSQSAILQDLVNTVAQWETPRVSAITEGPSTVTMDEFIAKGGWVMNSEMSDALRVPVRLFWAMLIARLRNRPEGASPILLLLDEFGDCGKIPQIERALVLLRSKGVAFVAGIQNLGLLKDVYPQNWQAVVQGFGSKVWLLRNADDETRETLTRVLGKWTRKVPASSAKTRPTEREADLMPLDAWAQWSDERVALARSHGWSYWLPVSLSIPAAPLGARMEASDPWEGLPVDGTPTEETQAEALQKEAAFVSEPVLELLKALEHLPPPPPKPIDNPAGTPPAQPTDEDIL